MRSRGPHPSTFFESHKQLANDPVLLSPFSFASQSAKPQMIGSYFILQPTVHKKSWNGSYMPHYNPSSNVGNRPQWCPGWPNFQPWCMCKPVTSHVFDFGHPKTCSFAASKQVPRYSKWPYTTNKEKPRGDPSGIRSVINQQYSGDTTPEQHGVGLDSMLSTIKVHGLHDI